MDETEKKRKEFFGRYEGMKGVALVGGFRIPVLIGDRMEKYNKVKFFCTPTCKEVTGGDYVELQNLIVE